VAQDQEPGLRAAGDRGPLSPLLQRRPVQENVAGFAETGVAGRIVASPPLHVSLPLAKAHGCDYNVSLPGCRYAIQPLLDGVHKGGG
jgi:hypothetical protein